MSRPTEPENNPAVAHEPTDADAHAITRFGIALALIVILSQLMLWWLFDRLSGKQTKLSPPVSALIRAQAPKEPPEPRLQGNPQRDMKKMLEDEDAVLNHYSWVDPYRGIVRLPVDRALEIVAQKGLPRFQAMEPKTAASPKAVK
ncbi:MAG TPA: hypothetical protein VFO27_08070 [Bryobacteraceae bacterium]|nr:hypothetical protein [Bryobacteraceae bacterium]